MRMRRFRTIKFFCSLSISQGTLCERSFWGSWNSGLDRAHENNSRLWDTKGRGENWSEEINLTFQVVYHIKVDGWPSVEFTWASRGLLEAWQTISTNGFKTDKSLNLIGLTQKKVISPTLISLPPGLSDMTPPIWWFCPSLVPHNLHNQPVNMEKERLKNRQKFWEALSWRGVHHFHTQSAGQTQSLSGWEVWSQNHTTLWEGSKSIQWWRWYPS